MTQTELLRMVALNDWLWEQWWPALMALSPEQAHKPVGGSFESVWATTAHLVGSETVWMARLEGNPSAIFPSPKTSLEALKQDWEALATHRMQWMQQADPEAKIPYNFSGGSAHNTVGEIALHFASHAHFHRGQLASQFRMLGLTPPSSHYIGFFRL